jgi:DNA-directed RNA polymerase subunit RPC12/RpoP
MNDVFRVELKTYIYVNAECGAKAGEKAMDILNTAYEQGNHSAYFVDVEVDVFDEDGDEADIGENPEGEDDEEGMKCMNCGSRFDPDPALFSEWFDFDGRIYLEEFYFCPKCKRTTWSELRLRGVGSMDGDECVISMREATERIDGFYEEGSPIEEPEEWKCR